jgi:hypothetical protein
VLVYGATKPNEHEKERNTAGITISIPVAPNPESAQGFSFVLQATAQRVDNLVQHLNHDEKTILALALAAGLTPFAGSAKAQVFELQSDLQLASAPGQVTQPGWVAENAAKLGVPTLQLTPTQNGLNAGITASLAGTVNWESRGGTVESRGLVTGTSFDGVVSDLWVTRALSFNLNFSGLAIGATYMLRSWHNDSYTINQGFAEGGGIVRLSATDATVLSKADGTITNLYGAKSDGNFGIASISFVPTSSTTQITFTRIGGSITALPVNGLEF